MSRTAHTPTTHHLDPDSQPNLRRRVLNPLRWPWQMHLAATLAALVLVGVVNTILERMYVATGYPVPFFEGQTTFSGATVKGHFAQLRQLGTMDDFVRTQLFDYVFMASVALAGVIGGFLLVRWTRGRWQLIGRGVAIAFVAGAAFDAFENAVSFFMIADPAGFPDALAILHSSLAVAKFACMGLGMLLATLGLIVAIVGWVRGRR